MTKTKSSNSMTFTAFTQKIIETRTARNQNCFSYDIAFEHVKLFSNNRDVEFKNLSREWLLNFKEYLNNASGLRCHKRLSHNSANSYFRIVLSIVKEAADHRYVDHQILTDIVTTKRNSNQAASLSLEELQRLAQTPYRLSGLKNAFLLSCLTGLQWSEIAALKWRHLEFIEGVWILDAQRSGGPILLNEQARELLGAKGNSNNHIFKLHYSAAFCVNLKQWALKSGVLRNITFNTARHTFGKLLLDRNIQIELVSELLGHKQIKTTQKLYGIEKNSRPFTTNYL